MPHNESLAEQFAGATADWRDESAFAVDRFGGAAQLLSLPHNAKLFRCGIVYKFIKKAILPVISLFTIAILGGSLAYEIIQRHRDVKRNQQFFIALGVQL
jgi:hypothetical protein